MPLPVRTLPVVQNWDCHNCGSCCREYLVHVTDEEKKRIEEQGWSKEPEFAGKSLFRRVKGRWALNDQEGGCIFLDERGWCRIHSRFGPEGKPLACRVYPFLLVPAGNHWKIGLRFACPSVTGDIGRPIRDHLADVRHYADLLLRQTPEAEHSEPPPLQGRQRVAWDDLQRFVDALGRIIARGDDRIERRLRKCLALATLCREARFDTVRGKRLEEFLAILDGALDGEVAERPEDVPAPSWIGRLLFRQWLALYIRKDTGQNAGIARRGRLALLAAAVRFVRGRGQVPAVHGWLPNVTFEQLEQIPPPWPSSCEQLLERYYLTKLYSMQFAGPTNFWLGFWDGLESLALTFPAIAWLSRAFSDRAAHEAVSLALRIVDDSFGYHPLLGTARQRLSLRILSFRGEIPRLIAWYGRTAAGTR
ncbi:MAG: YkgJ family cysteine cluster protein [Gemmataceae bacterium]|nr:YkgJ family cysteine cluster protein [Gemmataceae bacterium]